jgi:hypothetical protein
MLAPVATFHLWNQDLPPTRKTALAGVLKRGIDVYLSGEYNSRFRALENWYRAPVQWKRLYDVVRKGRRPRPDWFVYKEPFISLAPEYVFASLPEARIVYIYRDGRDVANSLVESYDVLTDSELTHLHSAEMRLGRPHDNRYVPWWVKKGRDEEFIGSSQYVRAIWMWAYMAQRCHDYFSELDPSDRVLKVQYEEFMRQPHKIGDQLLRHLEAENTRSFRRHLDRARTSSIGKHKNRPSSELRAAESIAGPALKALGYQ